MMISSRTLNGDEPTVLLAAHIWRKTWKNWLENLPVKPASDNINGSSVHWMG